MFNHCEWRNNDKVKKTISKMAESPKNGVRKVVFLSEVDFNKYLLMNLLSDYTNYSRLLFLLKSTLVNKTT